MRRFLLLMALFTFLGCVAVNKSIDNYKACKGDPVCLAEMNKVKEVTYDVVEPVAVANMPSMAQVIALTISNIVAFGFGVLKGRKR